MTPSESGVLSFCRAFRGNEPDDAYGAEIVADHVSAACGQRKPNKFQKKKKRRNETRSVAKKKTLTRRNGIGQCVARASDRPAFAWTARDRQTARDIPAGPCLHRPRDDNAVPLSRFGRRRRTVVVRAPVAAYGRDASGPPAAAGRGRRRRARSRVRHRRRKPRQRRRRRRRRRRRHRRRRRRRRERYVELYD